MEQDRPILPQAPDDVCVDPLRMKYNGEHLFVPVDHMFDGARHVFDTFQDPLSREILSKVEIGNFQNSPIKCLPNLPVVMKLCHDLASQVELTPRNDEDPILDPYLEWEDLDLDMYDPNGVMGGISVGRLKVLGCKAFVLHMTVPILTWQQMGSAIKTAQQAMHPVMRVDEPNITPPMATKLILEISQVPGVMGSSVMAPYALSVYIPKLFIKNVERIQKEVEDTALRVIRQCMETRLREETIEKRK